MTKQKGKKPFFSPASKKQALMLKRASDTQILVIGGAAGSGKSTILNHLPLMLLDDGKTNCIMYRRTNPQLLGGLWPNARAIYEHMPKGSEPKAIRDHKMEVVFPNGAKIKYQQAENVARSKMDAQGQEFTFVGIDEGTQFEWEQIEYFMSRLRSPSKHFSRMVISCNPSPSHEIKDMISWYLDPEGFPDPEKDGVIRYFVQEAGEYIWGDTREDLGTRLEIPKERWEGKILSFSFVSGTIYDNPIMMEINPSYLAFLEGLNDIDRAQLLHGCWAEMAFGAKYFKREWLQEIDKVPANAQAVRSYDFGASERTVTNKNPDPTTCIKMYKSDGYYILSGEYHEDFYDEVDDIQGTIYKRSGDRDNTMIKQAEYDGREVYIVAPQDPAAAGKTLFAQQAKFFTEHGFVFKKDPCPINKNKLTKFLPFASACEVGLVKVVKNTFSEKTYNYIMRQLESFDGERSTTTKKDDYADTIASAFNYLSSSRMVKPFSLPDCTSSTKYTSYRNSIK